MNLHFFVLGRNPELSLAELYATLPQGWKIVKNTSPILLAELPETDIPALTKRLGGTIKIGFIQGEIISYPQMIESIVQILKKSCAADQQKKIIFGINAYSVEKGLFLPNTRQLRGFGLQVKKNLRAQGYNSRLVTANAGNLSSVAVKKEHLLDQGAEINLFYTHDKILLGHTLAVQEFEQASQRDFGRPARSMGVGMLPVQLAKTMINLARASTSETLLDPFCGLGTILSEAAAMGYQNLVGTDIEPNMISSTEKNLHWLQTKSLIPTNQLTKLFQSPAQELSKHLPANGIDAIITEPYMGPTRQQLEARSYELGLIELYIQSFEQFAKILKPGGRVVFIFPAFQNHHQLTKTSDQVLPKIKNLGFEPIQLLPSPSPLASSFSILYSRPDQKVLREIFIFEFKPKP